MKKVTLKGHFCFLLKQLWLRLTVFLLDVINLLVMVVCITDGIV